MNVFRIPMQQNVRCISNTLLTNKRKFVWYTKGAPRMCPCSYDF